MKLASVSPKIKDSERKNLNKSKKTESSIKDLDKKIKNKVAKLTLSDAL